MNGLLHLAAQCWIVRETFSHKVQNHSTTGVTIYSYLADYVQFFKQERFVQLLCVGSY